MDESSRPEAHEQDGPVGVSSTAAQGMSRQPRVYSFRWFLLELATITAGVLIALSVDSVREWQQHRSLVRQARATIAREIAAKGPVATLRRTPPPALIVKISFFSASAVLTMK